VQSRSAECFHTFSTFVLSRTLVVLIEDFPNISSITVSTVPLKKVGRIKELEILIRYPLLAGFQMQSITGSKDVWSPFEVVIQNRLYVRSKPRNNFTAFAFCLPRLLQIDSTTG
jgi:hypothetical protein